jgi:hypothetical protein
VSQCLVTLDGSLDGASSSGIATFSARKPDLWATPWMMSAKARQAGTRISLHLRPRFNAVSIVACKDATMHTGLLILRWIGAVVATS